MENLQDILQSSLKKTELDSQLNKCPKCGEPIQKDIEILGSLRRVPVICSCKKKEMAAKKEQEEKQHKQDKLKQLFKNSLMDNKFLSETFENWDREKGSDNLLRISQKYCDNFRAAKKNGLGFLIYGPPGNGKTFTSNCIANCLLNKGFTVVCVSINSLLERIKKTFNSYGKEGEDTVLNGLANADLLVLDDLGTEQKSDWTTTKVYNIIDSRYRNGLPLIITTNYSIEDLKEKYGYRTADRILEMCTPIQNKAKSIRQEKAKEKAKLMNEIMKG